jgi:hypothetical protein
LTFVLIFIVKCDYSSNEPDRRSTSEIRLSYLSLQMRDKNSLFSRICGGGSGGGGGGRGDPLE